jgi:hypothetical protein
VRRLKIALTAALLIAGASNGAFAAGYVRCPAPHLRVGDLPHEGFGAYRELKRLAPTIASCENIAPLAYCPVLDPWGYVDTFSDVTRVPAFTGPKERYLQYRTAHRAQKARLPYGLLWSDSISSAMRRLKALGLDPRHGPGEQGSGSDIEVSGCSRYKDDPGFLTTLHFDAAGMLQTVKREDHQD